MIWLSRGPPQQRHSGFAIHQEAASGRDRYYMRDDRGQAEFGAAISALAAVRILARGVVGRATNIQGTSAAMDQRIGRDPAATLSARRAMVDNQIRTFDVTDQPLLDRFYTIPREFFMPSELADLAYSDAVLTVGSGTKRAQLVPMVLARMLQGAKLETTDRVLVVGAGTGYAAAIVAGLVATVVALESDAALSEQAAATFQALGLTNVTTETGSLNAGDPKDAPFDLIVVPGAIESRYDVLLSQLAPRGRMVTIKKTVFEGARRTGKAVLFERFGTDTSTRSLFDSSAPVLADFREAETFAF